jgi:ubiquinone/menaquinone biosynthesis C-methylase UbiE
MQFVPADYFVVAESGHQLQNPTSEEKLLLLGRTLGLGPGTRVLDIASGRGGPAVLLASEFGCSVRGIEMRPEFHAVAVERAEEAGVSEQVWFELGVAAGVALEAEEYDVALCLGATFVWRDLSGTLDALSPVVRPGGHVVVGEPYWRRLPLPAGYEPRNEPFTTLADTVLLVELSGLLVVSVIASSEDDWDRYETLHWNAVERWLEEHADDAAAPSIRARHEHAKETYLRYGREYLGWAIFAGWKRR